jgi:hypothetical protein
MNQGIETDFTEMETKLKCYADKGRVAGGAEVREEPMISVKPDASLIKPLKKVTTYDGSITAVDCSTRTLKRANNWGIYLMRPVYAIVKKRVVDWGFEERICTAVGDAYSRSNYLKDKRIELESQMALKLLHGKDDFSYYDHANSRSNYDHTDGRGNYLLLDGGGYFGGERKFRVSLYDKCEKDGIILLAISKNSPLLHDDKGRDLVATVQSMALHDVWVYYPVRKAEKDQSLYGDIAIVKLCTESSHVFRCDIMDYLTQQDISELLSPLTSVSEDPRCIGYPISLYLAHDFSAPSDAMLLSYHDQIEEKLSAAGLLEALRLEERSCSFADELHGVKHAFGWEWWGDQF